MISDAYDGLIMSAAQAYAVPFEWIKAIIGAESDFNPNAYRREPSGVASYGLMQILDKTAAGLGYTGDLAGLYDPAVNIDLGAKLLSQLRGAYGDDFRAVYSAYNSGSATKYLTNGTVATHVARAVSYLDQVIARMGTVIEENPEATGAAAFMVGLGLLYFIMAKRKRGRK